MAISIQFLNQENATHAFKHSTLRQFRRSKPDLCRLSTFRLWKTNTQCNISPSILSKVGFSYTGKKDKVKCDACGLEIDSWTPGMDPKQEHMERSPQCPFVLNEHELFSTKDQSKPVLRSPNTRTHLMRSDGRDYVDHGGGGDTDYKSCEKLFLQSLSTETVDRARTYTFSNWPSITPSAQEMVCAGWWYTNIADRVICIHCNAMFHGWIESDRPYEIHRLKSPQCFFVRVNGNKSNDSQKQIPVPNPAATNVPNSLTIVGAVHAEFASIFRRKQTFNNWPEAEQPNLPAVQSFVDAGFFYTGDKTIVRCFYCNGALRNWQASDDPKVEHARWFPQCAYIRQFVGENLYQAIQRKNRELRAQQNLQENSNGEASQYIPWTPDEIERMVKARLDLPVVEKLRQEGYSMAIIRKVYEMQLRFKKDDFKTDVDLRVACLILDKQVKLINGNEANIFIPQNWIKNGDNNVEQVPSTQSPQTKTISVVKQIEARANSPTIKPTPPKQTLDTEEPSLCVLCLTTERQVACLPCGHLTSCVACGHSLKTCPICRAAVKAFVRIYV